MLLVRYLASVVLTPPASPASLACWRVGVGLWFRFSTGVHFPRSLSKLRTFCALRGTLGASPPSSDLGTSAKPVLRSSGSVPFTSYRQRAFCVALSLNWFILSRILPTFLKVKTKDYQNYK